MKEVLKEKLRRSLWLEIDLDQLESNYLALKEMVGSVKVMDMATELFSAVRFWQNVGLITWEWEARMKQFFYGKTG